MSAGSLGGSLVEAWDALADRTGVEPFLRPGWFAAWRDAFAPSGLRVLTVRDRGELVGVLPVVDRAGSIRSASNWHTPWFGAVAETPEVVAELADRVLRAAGPRASMAFVRRDDPLVDAFDRSPGRHRVRLRVLERSPFVRTDGPFESYRRSLDAKLRAEVRRRRRRLEELGPVSLEVVDGSERLESLLDEGLRVEASGWKGRRTTAIVSRPETLRFYTDVARWAAGRGWLRLAFLRVGGRAVAFDLCLEDGRHWLLKTSFDPAFSAFAPGTLLRSAMIERAFGRGLDSYEFLGTDEGWKLRWTREVRELVVVDAFARSPAGAAQRWAETYGRPIGSWARGALLRIRQPR